jgi:hypothetical protein
MGCLSWQHSWLRLQGLERQYCSSSWIVVAAAAKPPFARTALGRRPASRLRYSFLFDGEMSLVRSLIDFGLAMLFSDSTWRLEHRFSSTVWRCSWSDSLSAKKRWRSMANSSSPSFANCFPRSSSSSFDDFK